MDVKRKKKNNNKNKWRAQIKSMEVNAYCFSLGMKIPKGRGLFLVSIFKFLGRLFQALGPVHRIAWSHLENRVEAGITLTAERELICVCLV